MKRDASNCSRQRKRRSNSPACLRQWKRSAWRVDLKRVRVECARQFGECGWVMNYCNAWNSFRFWPSNWPLAEKTFLGPRCRWCWCSHDGAIPQASCTWPCPAGKAFLIRTRYPSTLICPESPTVPTVTQTTSPEVCSKCGRKKWSPSRRSMKVRVYVEAKKKSAHDAFSCEKNSGSWRIHGGEPFGPLITKIRVIVEPEERCAD